MNIVVADPTGLCFGVKRAINSMEKALEKGLTVYCIGSPIHNPQEISRLESLGLKVVASPEEIPPKKPVFIRAHGIAPHVLQILRDKEALIIDGTCPFVRKAQDMARILSEKGYFLLVLGDKNHPEIQGILGYTKGPYQVVGEEKGGVSIDKIDKVGIISQTTQQESNLRNLASSVIGLAKEIRIYNTICRATVERQNAVRQLAGVVDGIIVIGGHNSANTKKLYRIAQETGTSACWVEQADQLDKSWLSGKNTIGIAAGASTPDWLINQLKQTIL